jgi:hypothetical protein
MPIEGYWNTVKAFFLTQADLEESDRLNTYANESLWYVQYFFGCETIEQKVDKFYLVQKPETAGKASWIPCSLKTAAYFVSALIWIIPGAIARLLSFDSEEVRAAVLADRITTPPPKVQEVPRSLPADAPSEPPSLLAPPQISPPTVTPSSAPAKQPICKPFLAQKAFKVDPAARATTDINHHRLLNELEFSVNFFIIFNALADDKEQVAVWLKIQQRTPFYRQPFLFSFTLQGALEKHQEKILSIIPPQNLKYWLEAFNKAATKLKELGLTADEVEFIEEKQPQQEKKPKGFVGTLKSFLSSEKSSESTELNVLIDDIIAFYTELIKLKSNRAKWLQSEEMEALYWCPFFNTLYLRGWKHPSLDPEKLKRLAISHKVCVEILYQEGLEHHLTEIPHDLPSGLCALVHCMTQDLIQCPASLKNVSRNLPIPDDAKHKQLLIQGIEPILYMPGIQAILSNPQHFQRNKYKLFWFLKMMWLGYIFNLQSFVKMDSRKKEVLQWISMNKDKKNIIPFSKAYKDLCDTLSPILDDSVYNAWNEAYSSSVKKLNRFGLSSLIQEPIPVLDSKTEEIYDAQKYMARSINFFKKFIPMTDKESEAWLAQEASKIGYVYPFFRSLDLACRMERLKAHLNSASVSEWETLYQQACSKLTRLGLTKYLDEIPSGYFENLIAAMTESAVRRFHASGSPAAPQPFFTSTKGMARSSDSNSGK